MNEQASPCYWIAANRSGRANPRHWKSWADRIISKTDLPSEWLIQLSLANSTEELLNALREHCLPHRINEEEMDDAVLGHMWMRFENQEISIDSLLEVAGEFTDGSESTIECEEIYAILNRLRSTGDATEAVESARVLFTTPKRIAQSHWNSLMLNTA